MEMYVTDRCRFFDARLNEWIRAEITDISIIPFPVKQDMSRTEVVISVRTSYGDFELLGTEDNLNRIQFRITFSDFPRAWQATRAWQVA